MNDKTNILALGEKASWGAVFAGVIVALTVQSLLNLLGLGLGLVAFTPDPAAAGRLGVGAVIWLFLGAIVAMGVGGWVTGRLAETRQPSEGAVHGIVTWGLATLLTLVFMAGAAGAVMSGAINVVGKSMATSQQIQQQIQNLEDADARDRAKEAVEDTAKVVGQAALVSFFVLLMGAGAAGVGGSMGAGRSRY